MRRGLGGTVACWRMMKGLGGGIRMTGMEGTLKHGMEGLLPRHGMKMMMSAAGSDAIPAEDENGMAGLKSYRIWHYSRSVC